MTNYLTQRQFTNAKSRLTRAQKKGPQATIEEVRRTLQEWHDGDYAFPDDWHRWERALDDARYALQLEGRYS